MLPAPALDPAAWLGPDELCMFERQSAAERRHALLVAHWLLSRQHVEALLVRAALLHDVGKAEATLALWHRVVWVLSGRLPPGVRAALTRRGEPWAALAAHASRGAARLQDAGADQRLVALIAGRPLPGDEALAALLAQADDAV